MKNNKLWFKAKTYGWGWCPTSWQGFLITLISILVFIFFWRNIMQGKNILINFIVIIIDFTVLLLVCYKKGEKPQWRWGNKK